MIPRAFIHDLLNRVDIIDAIGCHVSLKKAGSNYIACCPFHNEKTPSFTVSPTKQFYHCFGCGAHGDAINFLAEYCGLSFTEAIKELAVSVGMQVPEQQSGPSHTSHGSSKQGEHAPNTNQDLFDVMRAAAQFYKEQLKQSAKGIAYLKERGLSGQIAARFAMGYAPNGWQNLATLFADYHSEQTKKKLMRAGLVVSGKDEKPHDRFRDRIMFPILNQRGQIVAFGGRIIDQGEPKYLNSPETDLFSKAQEVYNLFSARKAIRDAQCVVVVEGYMDVAALSQHGIDYAVATLGTAITGFHIQKLLRQSDKIVFCFDGDNAGKKAAWRALEASLPQITDGKTINFLFLPEGEDPDSYVTQYGKKAFEHKIAQSMLLSEFMLQTLLCDLNIQTTEGRVKLIRDAKPLFQQIKAPALTLMLLKRMSQLCGLDQTELETLLQLKRVPSSSSRFPKKISRKQPASPYRWLILILLYRPAFISNLDKDLLARCNDNNDELAALKLLAGFLSARPDIVNSTSTSYLFHLQDSPYRLLLEKIESEILDWDDTLDLEAEFMGALQKLRQIQRNKRMTELHNKPLGLLTDEEKRELQRLTMD